MINLGNNLAEKENKTLINKIWDSMKTIQEKQNIIFMYGMIYYSKDDNFYELIHKCDDTLIKSQKEYPGNLRNWLLGLYEEK